MKAVVKTLKGYDNMALLEVPEKDVSKDLVKIKVSYTGICGTDIHAFKGEYANSTLPVTLGHEFSGTVVAIGDEVSAIKLGDRVTSETTYTTCGECDYCKEKDYNLCPNRKGIGTQIDGSFAEFVVTREESCHVLVDSLSDEAAALTEPLACCVHAALEKTLVKENDTVLIFGPGPIGLLLAQVAKSQNAKVIMAGITKDSDRLKLAAEIGVDRIVDIQKEDISSIVLAETNGYGAEKVFDCSGALPAVNLGLPLTRKKGDFVQVGLFAQQKNSINEEAIIQREINYIGCRSQKPSSWKIALDLLAHNKIRTDKMITGIYDLKDWRKGFEAVMSGEEIKILIKS